MNALTLTSPPQPLPPTRSPPLLTADEFFVQYEHRRAELVCGSVQELPILDFDHGHLCGLMTYFLTDFGRQHDLGRVMSNDRVIRVSRDPDTVRGAGV